MRARILHTQAIEVSNWQIDDEFGGTYPEGARSKDALFPPEELGLAFIIPARRYLFKRAMDRPNYPDQFWAEIVTYHAGCLLGVEVPPAFAAHNQKDGTCGALIEWFYDDGSALYVPGGDYMLKIMPDFDRKKGKQHNFHSIKVLCRAFSSMGSFTENWMQYWGEVFLFDALIGNTDRHQDNWGVLFYYNQENQAVCKFSPLFDNGTSMGHERFPNRLIKWNTDEYLKYINKGKHHVKLDKTSPKGAGHFELVTLLANGNADLKIHLYHMINAFSLEALRHTLTSLENIELPIKLSRERSNLYYELIALRRSILLAELS